MHCGCRLRVFAHRSSSPAEKRAQRSEIAAVDYSVAVHVTSPTTRKHPILRHECGMRIAVRELAIQGVPIGSVNLPVAVAIAPQWHDQFVDRFPGDEQQIAVWPLGDVDDR